MDICTVDVFSEPESVKKIAQIYRAAFGGTPWNEGYICPICRHIESLESSYTYCPNCLPGGRSIIMVEHWPEAKVISDLYKENSEEGSLCLGALWRHNLVGFAWGYQLVTSPENLQKLEAPNLLDTIPYGIYFYLDECAVLPEFQQMGLGKSLIGYLSKKQHASTIILRTLRNSQMHNLILKKGGKELLSISKNRLIMSLSKTAHHIPWGTYFPHY